MSRYVITLNSKSDRERAAKVIEAAPPGTRVEVKASRRSIPMNDKMWAMLTDIAQQVKYHGRRLRPNDYKILFLDALDRETQMVPNLDNTGFLNLGRSSSDLTKSEMSDLFILLEKFAAENDVKFSNEKEDAA